MKNKLVLLALLLAAALACRGADIARYADETLHYRIMYKWGLINKCAGTATVSLRNDGKAYQTLLTAKSEPWADKFYMVRDTLRGRILRDDYRPLLYEKIAHEGKEHKHDVVNFSYNPATGNTHGDCLRRKWVRGELREDATLQLDARGDVVDMLSSFWYVRGLPYQDLKPGAARTATIFSGKEKEVLSFLYRGIETVTVDGKQFECYHVTFVFTSDGRKKTSDDMEAWITTGPERLPVKLEGELAVGRVQCFLTDFQ